MKSFLHDDFFLDTETGRELYFRHAAPQPIFDFHNHLSPQAIAEDRPFEDIAQVWLGGDHYKWRLMRADGADESLCSGNAPWPDKFAAFARAMTKTAGNPILHWSHLELKRTYGIDDVLTPSNASDIRDRANAIMRERRDSPRSMLKQFGVAVACTTDDPADSLTWHKAIAADPEFGSAAAARGKRVTRVLPTFRPDKAMNAADAAAWKAYAAVLGAAAGIEIRRFSDLAEALSRRHAFFHETGCRISDHALLVPPYAPASEAELDTIVASLLSGREQDALSREKLAHAVLDHVGRLNAASGWTMQLHIGALRNIKTGLYRSYGPDGGSDGMSDAPVAAPLAAFLDSLDRDGALPKTILYTLNPASHETLAVLSLCLAGNAGAQAAPDAAAGWTSPFGTELATAACPGKMQYGAAWWFNDHKDGMERHLAKYASVGLLGRWVGMLTDSRSFLSFPRHEYFRRILCGVVGRWVESGELPEDDCFSAALVRNVSWGNAESYFGIEVPAWAKR